MVGIKSRIIIDLLVLEKGKAFGFQEYVLNLLCFFYAHQDDIKYGRLIVWCNESEKDFFASFSDKFEIHGFKVSSYFKRHWLQTVLPIRYRLGKTDLLFSPGNVSGVIKKCPEILTIHDLLFKRKIWLPNRLMRLQREILIPISIRKADRIVAISSYTKEDIEHFYPIAKGKIEVIYNSFNFNKYEGEDSSDLVGEYFLVISTNADYKNQKTILKAFDDYCARGGDKSLVLIGRKNDNSEAGKVYGNLPQSTKNKIIWKCNISNSELGAIYRGASCFISASKFEGLGMPVVEAMSFGLPVILSDIPPHREVSMNKGIFFNPEDYKELARILSVSDFSVRDYGKSIRALFSEDNTSMKYIELINSFCRDIE